jgi:hypothetical protein
VVEFGVGGVGVESCGSVSVKGVPEVERVGAEVGYYGAA